MSDRGAAALAKRLPHAMNFRLGGGAHVSHPLWLEAATDALRTTGLFIADVTKHEPVWNYDVIACSCGWVDPETGESYFDHLTRADQ